MPYRIPCTVYALDAAYARCMWCHTVPIQEHASSPPTPPPSSVSQPSFPPPVRGAGGHGAEGARNGCDAKRQCSPIHRRWTRLTGQTAGHLRHTLLSPIRRCTRGVPHWRVHPVREVASNGCTRGCGTFFVCVVPGLWRHPVPTPRADTPCRHYMTTVPETGMRYWMRRV